MRRDHVSVPKDFLNGIPEAIEAAAPRIAFIAFHDRRPLMGGHGTRPGICQQIDQHIVGGQQEHVVVRSCEQLFALVTGGPADRLDTLDAKRFNDGPDGHRSPRNTLSYAALLRRLSMRIFCTAILVSSRGGLETASQEAGTPLHGSDKRADQDGSEALFGRRDLPRSPECFLQVARPSDPWPRRTDPRCWHRPGGRESPRGCRQERSPGKRTGR